MSEPAPEKPVHWRRAIRPLIWWGIMVLLMFAYRTHERLTAKTHISFEPVLTGKPAAHESQATINGKSFRSGQQISIGWHTLTVAHQKTKPFSTNLFVWYGQNDLGQIALERAHGTLIVNAAPAAQKIEIRGPEFSDTLTNTAGITSSVPTDRYVIEASYKHWRRRDEATVNAGQSTTRNFAPKLATLHIEASHPDIAYELLTDRERIDTGRLPTTIDELPEGNYRLISSRKSDKREMPVILNAGATNAIRVEFIYGAAVLESDPPGATVYIGRNELGVTPLLLPELKPGNFEVTLQLNDYEPVTGSLAIVANQTNGFRTNLVSRYYTRDGTSQPVLCRKEF